MRHQNSFLICSVLLSSACGARSSFDTLTADVGGVPSFDSTKATGGANSTGGMPATGGTQSTGGSTNIKLVAKSITAGVYDTCALLNNGMVQCWGYNLLGQLGNGTTTNSSVPVMVSGITNATAITAGGGHNCAALTDGAVLCWGYNEYYELGNGTTDTCTTCTMYCVPFPCAPTPVTVAGISNATAVTAGLNHTCAVLAGGMVQCWGYGVDGELGNDAQTLSSVPVTVSGITNASAVAAGWDHTCALLTDGTVQCWGSNRLGQLGNGTTTTSFVPVPVTGITNATAVAAGDEHACALLSGWHGSVLGR